MATQALPSYKGRAYFSINAGSSFEEFGEMTDAELHRQITLADATSHKSAGNKEFVVTEREWEITGTGLRIYTDAGQLDVDSALAGDTLVQVRFDPQGTSGASGFERFSGSGYFKDLKITQKTNDLTMLAIQFQGSGALTKSSQ